VKRAVFAIAAALALATALARETSERVVVLFLDGMIEPGSQRYLERGLQLADRSGAALTIIELNTPGGSLASLRQMTRAITASRTPVAVFVTPAGAQAASAGFFLLIASDVAAMSPGTNAGAAHPVGAEGELPKTLGEKATNDAAALIRSLAAARGRPVDWAERAVRNSLSYSTNEARDRRLIEVVATDRHALLARLDGRTVKRLDGRQEQLHVRGADVRLLPPGAIDRLLMAIAHPTLAYVLLLVGMLGLAFELTHPGLVAPGVVGGMSLLLALFAFSVLPVSYVGALLILLGVSLFVAEAWVPSYGLLTIVGLVSFVLGSLMLVGSPFGAPGIGLPMVLPLALLLAALVVFLTTRVVRTRRMRPMTGAEGMVGETGEVVAPVDEHGSGGKVFVHGEYWNAVASSRLPIGARVRVVRVSGEHLEVEASRPAQ
jgi:membrane-bound serine protease (ClpP class)